MAFIEFTSGRIQDTIDVTRHVFPEKHVFEWTWRSEDYWLDEKDGVGFIGGRRLTQEEFQGAGSMEQVFQIFKRQILFADGQGAFDSDDAFPIGVPPDDDLDDDPIVSPPPGGTIGGPPDLPPPPPGGQVNVPVYNISTLSVTAIPTIIALLRGLGFAIQRGIRIPWNAIPGWAQTILVTLGAIEGADFILDVLDGDGVDFPFFGSSGEDPIGKMVEAMTVSTWDANGVKFHRLSDGRLAVQNKHGVWNIWRPKKPIVIMPTGSTSLQDFIRADRVLDKQAKKLAKSLRSRGYKVSKT